MDLALAAFHAPHTRASPHLPISVILVHHTLPRRSASRIDDGSVSQIERPRGQLRAQCREPKSAALPFSKNEMQPARTFHLF